MLRSVKIDGGVERHEEVFLARYARLRAWALQLTGGERESAEDLVQDAFIHFTFARPELEAIGNLDGYLYSMLRNLHRSQTRRAQRLAGRALPVLEYDSAETTLRASDDGDRLRVQDELRQVCRYACARKETSKAGSVLILRFIHGYYPREIALVTRTTRAAVEERLRVARDEAARYLKNPESLRFLRHATTDPHAHDAGTALAQPTDEFLCELRRAVFQSRRGECLSEETLALVYREEEEETRREEAETHEEDATRRRDDSSHAPDAAALAHLVSCPRCMDGVNKLLALPPLAERYPTDSLGNDTKNTRGGDDGDGEGGGPPNTDSETSLLRRLRRRASDVFEHRPQQLCVSVNGRLLAAQKVGASLSEQTLNVGGAGEQVEFVEVFSEQEVRLLFLPVGGAHASARVSLSDERTLEATLVYDEREPTLRVVYQQPLAAHELAATRQTTPAASDARSPLTPAATARNDGETKQEREATTRRQTFARRILAALARFFGVLGSFFVALKNLLSATGRAFTERARHPSAGWRLRPGALAAGLAVLLVASLLFVRLQVTSVSAAELLRRSAAAEETGAADSSFALRRTFYVEELPAGARARLTRRRVEVWQSARRGLKLRRVYDEQDKLVAGEWARADGTSTVYRAGLPPQHTSSAHTGDAARDRRTLDTILEAGDLWRLEPSARTFSALAGDARRLNVEEAVGSYVIKYEGEAATADANDVARRVVSLLRASLRLNRADLRATEQTLAVRLGGATREFRFTEGGFERKRADEVAPDVFEPDAALLSAGATRAPDAAGVNQSSEERDVQPSAPAASSAPVAASAELEIEVTYLLNQIKANLGEQVGMTRMAGGRLRVEALVETERRKEEILRALAPVAGNPAVVVEVSTVDEALRRRPQQQQGATRDGGVREVEVASNRIPADAELRRHFSARLVGDARVEEEMKRFAERAMSRSRQALLHASALKRLASRFTPEQVRALAPEARGRWRAMIREHAGEYRREVERLRADLRSVFGGVASSGDGAAGADAGAAAEQLLRLSYSNDEAVRSAFAVSEDGGSADAVKSARFWRSLGTAERLAAAIEEMYRD